MLVVIVTAERTRSRGELGWMGGGGLASDRLGWTGARSGRGVVGEPAVENRAQAGRHRVCVEVGGGDEAERACLVASEEVGAFCGRSREDADHGVRTVAVPDPLDETCLALRPEPG